MASSVSPNVQTSSNSKSIRLNSKLFNRFLGSSTSVTSSPSASSILTSNGEHLHHHQNQNQNHASSSTIVGLLTSPSTSTQNLHVNGAHMSNIVINSSGSSSASSSSQHTPNHQHESAMASANHTNEPLALPANWSSNASITSSIKLEKKHFDRINKLAEKILKHCQSKRMNLINSPPYIIDIVPDVCQIFSTIYFVYEEKLAQLNECDYFCVLIKNCLDKFTELADLFKAAGNRMYEENSAERQKLVKYTLIYSHILAEMRCFFPKDVYAGESFLIAKKDAADFWKSNFGDRVIVSWKEFELKLNRVHTINNELELNSLRETIQLTKTKFVSVFEFDIFTRLFQPWNNLLNNWKFLVTEHPGYCAFSTYDEIHKRLQKHINKPGSYLFRLSCTKLGQWAIGYVTHDHKILQTIPQSLIQALIDGQKQGLYVYPDGRDIKIDISSAIAIMSASRIQISKEQFEMYSDMGTSFQLCKICSENNKDRKLEPCGHLICSTCLENWQELQSVPSCPFCRCEIKTFEPIIISPFEKKQPSSSSSSSKQKISQLLSDNHSHNEPTSWSKSAKIEPEKNGTHKAEGENVIYDKIISEKELQEKTPIATDILTSQISVDESRLIAPILPLATNSDSSKTAKSSDDDGYLKPAKENGYVNEGSQLNTDSHNSIPINCLDDSEAKFNIEQLLNNSRADQSPSTQLLASKFQSNQNDKPTPPPAATTSNGSASNRPARPPLPQAPSFPPPVPPSVSQGTTNANSLLTSNNNNNSPLSILSPPMIPPPPLPTASINSQLITLDASTSNHGKNQIKLNVENELQFEQSVAQLGTDRAKAACALFLANNDLKLAKMIVASLKNNISF